MTRGKIKPVLRLPTILAAITLLATLPLLFFLKNEMNLGLDGISHVARQAVFFQSLAEGNWVPRWAGGGINFGYGHPLFLFNYVTPYYLGSLLHLVGLSYIYSVKTVLALTFVLSGLLMFFWLREHTARTASLVGTLFFLFAPYRFHNILDRSALGESVSFALLPLVGFSFARLSRVQSTGYFSLACISIALLILTHFGITLIALPLFFLYFLFLGWEKRKRAFLWQCALALLVGFGVSGFLLAPALLEGKYTHHAYYLSLSPYRDYFVSLRTLLSLAGKTGVPEASIRLGPMHALLFLLTLPLIRSYKPRSSRRLLIGAQIVFLLSIFFTTEHASWIWRQLKPLQIILFPYRFLTITTLTSAMLAALWVAQASRVGASRIAISGMTAAVIVYSSLFWSPSTYWESQNQAMPRPDHYYEYEYPFTTGDWLSSPIWSIQFMEQFPPEPVEVIAGKAEVFNYARRHQYHSFTVRAHERSRLKENTLYFPGWRIWVNDKQVPIEFQDINHRGLMTFWVEPGVHTVQVRFTETKVRWAGNIVSALSVIVLLAVVLRRHLKIIA